MPSASGARAAVLGIVAFLAILPLGSAHRSASAIAASGIPASQASAAGAPAYPDLPAALPGRAGGTVVTAAGRVRVAGSLNWAGYAASRRTFRAVSAAFFVPYLNCAKSPGATLSAAWAGLDGFAAHSDSVEQTGVAANCSAAGSASYFAWFEMFPYAETRIAMRIRPGDSVTVMVSFDPARRQFRLSVSDTTLGEHFARYSRCPAVRAGGKQISCPRSSAEIITEAPATGSSQHLVIAPLSDYGAISFGRIAITDSTGQRGSVISRHWTTTKITQLRAPGGPVLAVPTAVAAAAFSDYWQRES